MFRCVDVNKVAMWFVGRDKVKTEVGSMDGI